MSTARKIAGNTAVQVAGRAIGTILGLATVAVMTRSLAPAGYGGFTTAMSYLQFFGILADFGLTITMTAMISEHGADQDRVASNVFGLRLATAGALFAVAPALSAFFPWSADIKAGIVVATLSFFFMSLSQVLVGVFQKHLASHLSAIAEVAGRMALLGGVLLAARANAPLTAYISAVVAGNLVQFALSWAYARRFVRLRLRADMAVWRSIIERSWPIGLSIAFNLIYLKGDVIALSLLRSEAEVGLYGAAYKVLDVITVVPMIFMGLALPLLTSAWSSHDHETFARRMRRAFDVLCLAAIPLAVGAWPVATQLMTFVTGNRYAASGPLLCILMLAGAAVFISALFGHTVVAVGLQRPLIWAYAADALISAILYAVVIPRFGGAGAAWVTVFSETFILLACAIAVYRRTRVTLRWHVALTAAAASALMYLTLVATDGLQVVLRVVLGGAVYCLAILASGVMRDDVVMLLGIRKSHAL